MQATCKLRPPLVIDRSSLGGDAQTIPKESARRSCTLWQKQAVSAGEISSLWRWKALLTPESGAQVRPGICSFP
ncbi:Hypp2044 [Branchiostoma lanceolatum]|uniref:Hypp2044 protein n=1 Tax=Branchiostoma lanceolatum TaxID=7740 RepID=A0A8K0ENL2_BRALA|nr:Hypp2044 [Branchiostoma lanceolatum]